ncbi:hypothetical protein ABL78_3020 [Leptomonas seymouri]|uniref:Uncharacterized protein n=1 Tax=Leptomonas seymouri TaxID=5684 RepID=A0A0N1I5E0_LEPSE|nr:hypothetical protein ABL78_3020 [Leptomonas seymouri]|eukprot:KPI87863.1 hypothetical protein ABL78_3020 [Leptomonas seymouri]
MEERRGAPGAARTKPPSANSRASLFERLQSENEKLRLELLQAQQKNVSLQQQLDSLRTNTNQIVKDAVAVNGEQMHALEERCHILADRLVASKRDEQVSESARVVFLLRSQQEERRFLKRGLEAMIEALTGAQTPVLHKATEDTEELHTGTVYRLLMTASNALLERVAAAKLEKARARLMLEHASSTMSELQKALHDATRATFEAVAHASSLEETLLSGGGRDVPQVLTMQSRGTAFSTLRSGFTTPSPYRRPNADSSSHVDESGGNNASHAGSSAHWTAAPASLQLSEELEWVCDVLKACVQGMREVDNDLKAAGKELAVPPPSQLQQPAASEISESTALHTSNVLPLAEAASPEMNGLLCSFLVDLSAVKKEAARQQEEMARQLAHQVDRHYRSTQQYEERIKLLEAECTRLLRYVERVSMERAKSSSTPPAAAATEASLPTPAAPSLVAPYQRQQQQPSSLPQHGAAVTPSNATQSTLPAVEKEEKDVSIRVTPERYVAKRRGAQSVALRSLPGRPLSPLSSTTTNDSNVRDSTRPLRSVRTTHQVRDTALPAAGLDASRRREDDWDGPTPAPRARVFSHSLLEEMPPHYRLDYARKLPLSPDRRTPPPASPATPSAAAAALWSRNQRPNASMPGETSSEADRFVSRRRYQGLVSPAPPPPPSPQPPSSSRLSISPLRRSETASQLPGHSGKGTLHHAALAEKSISVSSTSDHLSPPRRLPKSSDGLVSSRIRARVSVPLSSPDATATAAGVSGHARTAPEGKGVHTPTASPSLSPLREGSVLSTHPAQPINRTRLSQQLYNEAAADVFFSHSTSFPDGASTPTSAQQQQRQRHNLHLRSSSSVKNDDSPESWQQSPGRPIRLAFIKPDGSPLGAASLAEEYPRSTSLHSPRPLSPPLSNDLGALATTSREGAEEPQATTPLVWRRIKEETPFQQQQMPSPIVGTSDLFGTPREASWIDSR